MKLLCLSNGHGEDAIAVRILQALQQHPQCPELAALPIVGAGHAYEQLGIPIAGPVQVMPSGGFVYMDGRQLARDVQGGLIQLTIAQFKVVRSWAKAGGVVLAIGDIVPLLLAWLSGAPYAFVGTAKSEYYLRDEAGTLPRKGWRGRLEMMSASVYLPWERWLMSRPRCKAVFPRDPLTTAILQKWSIPAFDLGNPMMDGLEPSPVGLPVQGKEAESQEVNRSLKILLLPGSRPPEAYANWQLILRAISNLLTHFTKRPLVFLGANAPSLSLDTLAQALTDEGWTPRQDQAQATTLEFSLNHAQVVLTQQGFNDCLHQADLAIAMAGTATEQFVGLGKPAFILPGQGPQFTASFAEAQTRLLGPSVILVEQPTQVAGQIAALLHDPDRLHQIVENGHRRMGAPGAAQRIATCLMEKFAKAQK